MPVASLDIEFSKYWSQLNPTQKQSLLSVVKSFILAETKLEQYNQELKEAEEEFKSGNYITQEEMLKLITS